MKKTSIRSPVGKTFSKKNVIIKYMHDGRNMPISAKNTLQFKDFPSSVFASSKDLTQKEKIMKFLMGFWKFLCCCFRFYKSKEETIHNKLNAKNYSLPILHFFRLLIWVIRAKENLISRTFYKRIKKIKDYHFYMIDDLAFYRSKVAEKQEHLAYFSSFTMRTFLRKIKKPFRKMRKATKKTIDFLRKTLNFFGKKIPVIKPNQKYKVIWDFCIIFIISMYFLIVPMQLSFNFLYDVEFENFCDVYGINHQISKFFLIFPETMLIIDSLLKFISAYYENGIMITEKKFIVEHYLKHGLLLDFFAYMPILTQSFLMSYLNGTIIKLFQLLMFCKAKRVFIALSNFQEIISSNGHDDYMLSALRLILTILFITHLNACAWHALAYFSDNKINWLTVNDLMESSAKNRYLISYFWTISLFASIGVGSKILPQNDSEYLLAIAILLISALLCGYSLYYIKSILKAMQKERKESKEVIKIMNGYMNRKNVSFELKGKVRKYLEYIFKKQNNDKKENDIIMKLNKTLQKEVINEVYGKVLLKIPKFKENFSIKTLENLAFYMRPQTYSPEEYIYKENEKDDESIYILDSGNLEEVYDECRKRENHKVIKQIKSGELFGLNSFFSGNKRESSILSKGFSSVFEIKKQDFLLIIKKNLNDYQKFCELKDKIKLYNDFTTLKTCSSCKKSNHLMGNCPMLHCNLDRDFVIKRYIHSINHNERNPIFIRKGKKSNPLKKLNLIQTSAEYFIEKDEGSEQIDNEENKISYEVLSNLSETNEEEESSAKLNVNNIEVSAILVPNNSEATPKNEKIIKFKKKPNFKIRTFGPYTAEKSDENLINSGYAVNSPKLNPSVSRRKTVVTDDFNNLNATRSPFLKPKMTNGFNGLMIEENIKSPSLVNIKKGDDDNEKKNVILDRRKTSILVKKDLNENQFLFMYDFEEAVNFKQYFKHNNKETVILRYSNQRPESMRKRLRMRTKKSKNIL